MERDSITLKPAFTDTLRSEICCALAYVLRPRLLLRLVIVLSLVVKAINSGICRMEKLFCIQIRCPGELERVQ
jgi:hypothetical protein